MEAILKCQFVVVPPADLQIFPPGIIEFSGFDGTCSQECTDHMASDVCKGQYALQAEVAATCNAYRCWQGVSQHCGRFEPGQPFDPETACSSQCGNALSAPVCNGTEAIFPSFAAYTANVGPTGRDCSTRACSQFHLDNTCPNYKKRRRMVASSDLCNGLCYRALFREPCMRSSIQVVDSDGEPLGAWSKLFNSSMYGPLSKLCANVTGVTFTVSFEDYDYAELRDPSEAARFTGNVEEALEDVLEVLGITSRPAVTVSNLRPGSVLADITLTFTNDPGGASLLQHVLEANAGLLLAEFGITNVSPESIRVRLPATTRESQAARQSHSSRAAME